MKKVLNFCFIFICYFISNCYSIQHKSSVTFSFKSENIIYAKASENCLMFRTQSMNQTVSNVWFEIPSTYFVSVLSQVTETIVKVQYDSFVGYVFSDTISPVTFLPNNPVLKNILFDIKQDVGTQIWSSPSDSGRVLTTISADTKNIQYVASVCGEIPLGGNSNVWYYAKFTPVAPGFAVDTHRKKSFKWADASVPTADINLNLL